MQLCHQQLVSTDNEKNSNIAEHKKRERKFLYKFKDNVKMCTIIKLFIHFYVCMRVNVCDNSQFFVVVRFFRKKSLKIPLSFFVPLVCIKA